MTHELQADTDILEYFCNENEKDRGHVKEVGRLLLRRDAREIGGVGARHRCFVPGDLRIGHRQDGEGFALRVARPVALA